MLRDENNIARGYADSEFFIINDPSKNGKPFISLLNGHFPISTIITEKVFNLELLSGDPEKTNTTLIIEYSPDGNNFIKVDSMSTDGTGMLEITLPVNIERLQNSENAFFRVSISDGTYIDSDQSYSFKKRTLREVVNESKLDYISKLFDVPFSLNIADIGAIKDHEYLLTFDDISSDTQKYFNVFDLTDSKEILKKETYSPNNESPIFNGLSFTTEDVFTKNDLNRSAWNSSVSKNLNFSMNRFVLAANASYNGYAKPNDYKIVFFNTIVDTSVADTLFPVTVSNTFSAKPVNFHIFNLTTGQPVKFAYNTTGTITTTHNIWFIEELNDVKKRTWRVSIVDNEHNRMIPFGDTLYLYTYKGLSIYDTIKVLSNIVIVKNSQIPDHFYLAQNFPNPFNPKTIIRFGVSTAGNVKLEVFNMLGEKVSTLLNKELNKGEYDLLFDGSNISSGIYMYRLEINNQILVKKMLLLK